MCSTAAQLPEQCRPEQCRSEQATARRIAEIGRAIDDLAVKAGPAAQAGSAEYAGGDTDPIVARLAELWALLVELDPEVGRRLAGYQNLPTLTDLWLSDLATRLTAGTGPPVAR